MSVRGKKWLAQSKGQSIVEFVLVLPLLLLFLVGLVEVGFAFYNYMVLATSNREGIRLASRGRFTDAVVTERVVAAGGLREVSAGVYEPNLRTLGADPNLGVIVTHVPLLVNPSTGAVTLGTVTVYISGTIAVTTTGGTWTTRPIQNSDTQITRQDMEDFLSKNGGYTRNINSYRSEKGYDMQSEELVIVETFYAHRPVLLSGVFRVPNPMRLYFCSTMRIIQDSRID